LTSHANLPKLQKPTAMNSMTGMECTHSITAGMECSHSIPTGMEWSFHSCWSGIITFQLEWKSHSIPAGMEYHSRPSLKKYASRHGQAGGFYNTRSRLTWITNETPSFSTQAQSRVSGGCDDPDCDCGGGGGDHDGGVAVSA
jgi:hypothetical protein